MDKVNSLKGLVVGIVALATAALPLAAGAAQPSKGDTAGLSDSQILGIVAQDNAAELMLDTAASFRLQNPQVREFVQRMAEDDYTANQSLYDAISQSNMTVEESPQRSALAQEAWRDLDRVFTAPAYGRGGEDVDAKFLDEVIKDHKSDLQAIDEQLMPAAKSPQVKQILTQDRERVAGHLQAAQQLRQSLSGSSHRGGTK
jgi:putative membrane protein